MSDDFEIRMGDGGRVLVVLHHACTVSREAILALLAELGIEESAVVFVLPEDAVKHCADDVPVVIPIDQDSCDAPELETAGRQCGQAGGRIVVLFGDTFSHEGLHPIAEKYGAQCGWSAEQLKDCLNDPVAAQPRNSGGQPVSRPKSEQVKC
jgi:hypothetical protein